MESPIVFWTTEQDRTNLAILETLGLDAEAALRAGLTALAAECAPAAWALTTP